MKIPLSLIKEWIEIHKTPREIADLLTLAGIEVDKISSKTRPPLLNAMSL